MAKIYPFHGWICSVPIYEYDGWIFEFSPYIGIPWPLRKDLELRKRAGKKFYDMLDKFFNLPDDDQMKYRVGGGCQMF